ncbi:GNAT family N-acetyltransferase [uncultured Massilia sp.]|uniref:GNAT family N-acetyltransferase n=1 Tax=uncultured Massilia sp. TaxID=169973 RepID=UPI0025D103F7|nr:GNAT family N-acetyltransferase [uncultured Massilia sp.]
MPTIRALRAADTDALLAIWLRSVRATHHFLSPGDIDALLPVVRDQVLPALEVWVLEDDGAPQAFMGLDGATVEALFVDPARFRRGAGRVLLAHARALKGPLRLDVNEANPDALAFYLRMGFRVIGRAPVDGQGRPFPLLHLAQ